MKKRAKAANKPITFTAVFLDRLKKLARIFGDLFGRSKSIWVESETSSVFATNGHWGVKLPAPVGLVSCAFKASDLLAFFRQKPDMQIGENGEPTASGAVLPYSLVTDGSQVPGLSGVMKDTFQKIVASGPVVTLNPKYLKDACDVAIHSGWESLALYVINPETPVLMVESGYYGKLDARTLRLQPDDLEKEIQRGVIVIMPMRLSDNIESFDPKKAF